jgi:hypothetical protein
MGVMAYALSVWLLLMSAQVFWRLRAPLGFVAWIPKLFAGALSPVWFILGLLGVGLGVMVGAPLAAAGSGPTTQSRGYQSYPD